MRKPLHRRERWFLLGLLVFSVCLRVVFLLQVHDNPFFNNPTSDAYYYDAQAQSIAAGDVLGADAFFRAPGYPYWLGLIYAAFGHSYLAVRVIQHLLGVAAILLLYLLARRLFNPTVAAVAALLMAFYPVLMYFEGQLLFDSFLTFLCLSWFLLLYRARDNPTVWRWFVAGLLYGIISVTRPTFLPLALPLFGYEIWRCFKMDGKGKALRVGGVLMAGIALAILPVTIRNYVVANDAVLIASQGGINFYIGNNDDADGYTARIPTDAGASWEIAEMSLYVEKMVGHRQTPSEESNFWYAKGMEFIYHHPVHFGALLIKKFYLFWNAMEIPNNLNFYTFSQYSWLLRLLPVGFWCVGPLGALGMIVAWKARRGRTMIAFILMYCAVMIMFFVCDRYRLPVVPLLCVFAGYALVVFFDWMVQREYRPMLISATVLVLLALFVNSNAYQLEREEPVHQFYMLGLIEMKHENYAAALSHFEQASRYGKPIRNLYLHLGFSELMLGKKQQAQESFHKELSYHPDSYGALANLSSLYLGERLLDSAIVYGSKAIVVRPFMPAAYISVGQSYYLRHSLEQAESVFAIGSAKCGNAFLYGNYLLGGIHLERGNAARAEEFYRSIVQSAQQNSGASYEAEFLMPEEKRTGIDPLMLRAKALYGLGPVFAARKQVDSAAAYFHMATRLSPALADAWADLGVAFLQLRRFADADSAMQRALKLQPENFMYWYNYGSMLGATRRLTEAREAFSKALALQPDFAPAQRDLDFVNLALGK